MKDVLQTYKFNFEFNTKDSKKQLKSISDDVLQMLSDMDSASNKMKVFTNLTGYLEKLDKALNQFRAVHKDDFENMFGGLDAQLSKSLESALGLDSSKLGQLSGLRERIDSAFSSKAGVKELRSIAQDVNSLFASIGEKEPINIDEWFTGKGKNLEQRIGYLNDQLNDFYMSYQLITSSIKGGFGAGGASGFAAMGDEARQAADQIKLNIKELNSAKKQLESAKDTINKVDKKNSKTPANYKVDLTIESIQGLSSEFDKLNNEIASGDSTSAKYYNNLVKMSEVVIKLKGALKDINADESIKKLFVETKSGKGDSMFGHLSDYANTKSSNFITQFLGNNISQNIQNIINQNVQDLASLIPSVVGDGLKIGKQTGSVASQYQQLIDKLNEYRAIVEDINFDPDDDATSDKLFDIKGEIREIFNVSKDAKDAFNNLFDSYDEDAIDFSEFKNGLMNLLNVVEPVDGGLSEAQTTLKEFLSLADTLKDIDYMSEADVDKNITKLEDMKAKLIDLSEQGDITTADLQKINDAFDATEAHLKSMDHSGYEKLQNEADEFGDKAEESAQETSVGLETVESKTHGVTNAFQELINYISKSGSSPKAFFESLASGAMLLDAELSSILGSLKLIDAEGNVKLSAVGSGSINSGGMISDQYALISRNKSKYLKYAVDSQPKLFEAEKLGANVGTILDIFTDEVNDVMYELQKRVSGVGLNDQDHNLNSLDFLEATDEQIQKLIKDFEILRKVGLYVDHNGKNILYDKNDGFSFIDLASKSTWFTASDDNSLEENLDLFWTSLFGHNPDGDNKNFVQRLYQLAEGVTGRSVTSDYMQLAQSDFIINGASTANIEKEEVAHEQNAAAINAENQALKEQIDLKRKAQSMTWESFALDESLSTAKNAAGIVSLADQEKFWKQANYDKDVDFHSLSEEDADDIISKYFTMDERDQWYTAQDFSSKSSIENRILENDELRNAALNKLYHIYKKEGDTEERYKGVDDKLGFEDFLNREFTVYRGDTSPVLYGDEQKLSFSFDSFEASRFANYDDKYVSSTKIIPKNTVGSLATEDYEGEQEVFVPSDKLPYLSSVNQSFDDYYNKLGPKMQQAIDNRFVQLEKDRVKSLLGDEVTRRIENAMPHNPELLSQFKQGNYPDKIDLTGSLYTDGVTNDLLAGVYNDLPEIKKKLAAYYASLYSIDPTQQFRSKTIGAAGLLDAVVSDPSGVQQHIARLTGESKFNIFGQSTDDINSEADAHKNNTSAIQQEKQAQKELNDVKSGYKDVSDRLYGDMNDETWHHGKFNEMANISKNLSDLYDTPESLLAKGDYVSSTTGEVFDISSLIDSISQFEKDWHMNLDYVKDYIQKVADGFKDKKFEDQIKEIDVEIDDDDDFDFEDLGGTKYSVQDYEDVYNSQSQEAQAAINDLAEFYQEYEAIQAKIQGEPIDFLISSESPTLEETQKVKDTFEALQNKIQEINNMQLVETEDDQKRLQELQAEAVGLQNTLRSAMTVGNSSFSYQSTYGLSLADAIKMNGYINGEDVYSVAEDLEYKSIAKQGAVIDSTTLDFSDMLINDMSDSLEEFLLQKAKQLQLEKEIIAEQQKQESIADQMKGNSNTSTVQQELNAEQDITAEKHEQLVTESNITAEKQQQVTLDDTINDAQDESMNKSDGGSTSFSVGGDYALESTLQQTNSILNGISNAVNGTGTTTKNADGTDLSSNSGSTKKKTVSKISAEQKADKLIYMGALNQYRSELNKEMKKLNFTAADNNLNAQQQEIADIYTDTIHQIEKYVAAVKNGEQVEVGSVQNAIAALKEKAKVYKEQNNLTDTGNQKNKSKTSYGQSTMVTASGKYNSLQNKINANEMFANSGALQAKFAEYEASLQRVTNLYNQLKTIDPTEEDKTSFKQASAECNGLAKEVEKLITNYEKLHNDPNKIGEQTLDDGFVDSMENRKQALLDYVESTHGANAKVGDFTDAWHGLEYTIDNGDGTFVKAKATIDNLGTAIVETAGDTQKATSKFEQFVGSVGDKFKELWVYTASRFGVDEIIQQIRQGIEYVREIDAALTELKKVTNETDAVYSRFLQSMSKTAGVVGSTVSELTTMAAEWARLGYSIEESAKLAESTAILLNVSEFESATEASEALISTMQAFQYTADDSQHVVDILNEVGNNYAVSSDGIATALQTSASALMEAGNNLEQSVALVAAANKVVQDPSSVGSALRTISLRLRGTSVEVLEELGEETDGAAESVSKMQEKLKALTGVDILTDSGAYKDTYTILKDIAEVWDDMSSMDQAAALELMAGKNRANTLAAILNNIEDLKGAYESALDAEGSALRENEAYLDSIQGRIDLFTNALQTFWMNFIDTSVVKGVVDLGTSLLKILDTTHGKILAIASALMIYKKFHDKTKFVDMFKGAAEILSKVVSGTKSVTTATIAEALAASKVTKERIKEILVKAKLAGVDGTLTKEKQKLAAETLTEAFRNKELTASQYLVSMSSMGLKTALQGLWNVLKSNPIVLVAAAIAAAALAFDHFHTTAQEAADASKEAFDEIQNVVESTKSVIQSLESELSTLQDKIDELDGKKLSFAEDQEFERLKKQREELEHSLKVQEQLLELQRESSNKQAVASMQAYTKAASEGAEETQKTAKTLGTIGGILLGVAGAAAIVFSGGLATPAVGGVALSTSAAVGSVAAAGAAGGLAGNKIGEAAGSKVAENEGTYDSWYETYAKALDLSREKEQEALEKYQKDSSNIKKLDKWQEAQQKTSDIETEMYEHLSQMQQYYNGLEYGVSDEIDQELDTWYNFLDKFSIDQGASGAEVTALDRIFGENASEEIKTIKGQILDAVSAGKDFDFEGAINGSQELNNILGYVGLTAEDVKNYFTQIGEAASEAAASSKIISFKTHSDLSAEAESYKDILAQSAEIIGNNTKVTQDYKDALIGLVGSEDEVNECFYEDNKLVVKNEKALKSLLRQVRSNISSNVKLAKSQANLNYYNLVKQLNDTLNGTKRLDVATRDSIYTLLSQIDAVDRAIYQYQLLEDSLLGAHNAFEEFASAQEIDALNTYGDSYVEMAQTMYDGLYKTGQVGTEQFWASVEALIPTEVYQHLTEDADRMKAIYDYYNKNVLPTLRLDEDALSLDYNAIENFVKEGLGAGVFTGDVENFDLVKGLNLDEAAEKLGYTKTQAYALFAELDKYNTSGTEASFLSQLDDSLDGRVANISKKIEDLNRQKLALLEDGGYNKNKEQIDAINKQLLSCDKNLKTIGVEAYNMWQEYAKNDVALTALETIENKQKEITKEGAATLGLEWDEVKGKTIQQVYDEILAKQQELGEPTELTIQFAKDKVDVELDKIEEKLKDKKIDIEANVVWNESNQKYETAENSEHADDKDLQKYIELSNEGYTLDSYFSDGLTTTETYLSNIESILQNIYDLQSGNDSEENKTEESSEVESSHGGAGGDISSGNNDSTSSNFAVDNLANNPDSMFTAEQYEAIASFFTETIPEVAGDVGETLKKFFTETVPQEWEEFWNGVGQSFDEFSSEVEKVYNIAKNFFTETIPTAWNEFWAGVGEKFNEIKNDATELYGVVSKFFKETIPQKWEEFWDGVDEFLTEDVPYAIGYAAGVVAKFFTVTIPEKWDEFWEEVGEFIDNAVDKAEALCDAVETFITETIPEKWDEFWEEVGEFYEEVIAPVIEDVKNALSTFFNETLPTKWNEFWESIGEFFTSTIPNAVENAKDAVITFFTVTIPEKWNEFWDGVGQFISENIVPALSLLNEKLLTFFTVTVPEKWNGFWDAVGVFFTQTIPAALQQLGNKIIEFFTVTIPTKWTQFWASVNMAFIVPIQQGLQTIKTGITNFFTVTLPGKINSIWSSITSWISSKASSIWKNLTSGFTAGFGGGGSSVNGTAHARGTAYKNGSWGAPRTETALVGELGPEMLVRNGRWTTVGDNGAEFTQVKKGDIIFNHKQTEDLLSKGYVTGRGKAYASGTAYSGLWKPTSPSTSQNNKPGNDFSDTGNRLFNAADSLSSAADSISSSSTDAADEFREVFDWIEVRLEEINDDISLRDAQLENKIGYSAQNKTVDKIIDLNQKLYDNLIAGSEKYYAYANKLLSKVPAEYREAAKDGTIAIEEFVGEADEKTLEAIQEYREWVQKGDEAAQRAEEVLTEISELAKQAIDNIADDYGNKNSLREGKIGQLDAYNALSETTLGYESESIYGAMIKENNKIIANLENQRNKMQEELNAQVEAGNIKKYSQDWYDAVNDIAAVDTKIIELTTDTYNYQDAINELHWEHFDNLMSQYEALADETEDLIDILGNKDLVDEAGNWTDEGITSLGLLAQQMENAEIQAEQYEQELDYLNKNWKKLGYTEQEYLDKQQELKEGQREAIQSYHDSKDAIVDMTKARVDAIKEGIEREIESYEKLIETKKEELDAEKDLYDFQKNVADQQKNIADIERKLAAISADNSASARAQRAQLQAELAEAQAELQNTYYDRSISDQQEALDKELENFREEKDKEIEGWDEYLENTDQVVSDALTVVQANTETVMQTLTALGEEYSLEMSEALTSPWEEGSTAIQAYSETFGASMSATVDELRELAVEAKELALEIAQQGETAANQVIDNFEGYTNAEYQEPPKKEDNGGGSGEGSSTAGLVSALSGNIKYGDRGDKVKKLQQALNELGYGNSGTSSVDGIFGSGTQSAVKNFQRNMGAAVDGIVGPETKQKFKARGYAKGTTGVHEDQLAWIDELGDELIIRPKNGRLTFMTKGTGVVPADLTANLMKWGTIDPREMLERNRPQIGVSPSVVNNTTEIHIDASVGELVHVDHIDGGNLNEITKMIDKAWDKKIIQLNNAVRKYT